MDKLRDYLINRNVQESQIDAMLVGWHVETKRRAGSNKPYYLFTGPNGDKYKSFTAVYDELMAATPTPAEPPAVDWEIDKVVDMRMAAGGDGRREFLVHWTPSWVKEEDLDGCKQAVDEFLSTR
jgi:hypothetical protein